VRNRAAKAQMTREKKRCVRQKLNIFEVTYISNYTCIIALAFYLLSISLLTRNSSRFYNRVVNRKSQEIDQSNVRRIIDYDR